MPRSLHRRSYKNRNSTSFRRRRYLAGRRIARSLAAAAKRRRFKRRRSSYRSQLILGGFPDNKVVKLRYVQSVTLDGAAGAIDTHRFRLNDIYDPDATGTGRRPRFASAWDSVYENFTVLGSKISVQWTPFGASQPANTTLFGIYIPADRNDTAMPPLSTGDPLNILEYRGMKPAKIANGSLPTAHNGWRPAVTKKVGMKRFFKTSDLVTSSSNAGTSTNDFTGQTGGLGIGASPVAQCNAIVYSLPVDGTTDPGNVHLQVTIDFIVLYSTIKEPSPST